VPFHEGGMTVDVPALQLVTYRGQSYVQGEIVPMRPIDAVVYARRGLVSLTKRPMRAAVIRPEPEPAPIQPVRRRYRRRDLSAESA
jgi:hypothetical protein